jgi:hypothetical protein
MVFNNKSKNINIFIISLMVSFFLRALFLCSNIENDGLRHSPAVPRVKCNAVELYSWYGRLPLLFVCWSDTALFSRAS